MWKICLLAALVAVKPGPRTEAQAANAPCTLQKGVYTCDWQAFRARFAEVHTVSIEAQPMDRATAGELRRLVEALGKTVAAPDQPGDVLLRMAPANPSGIAIGPSDQPLASLQVYARAPEGGRGSVLWIETFRGQADRPWPMNVSAVIDQFQARFGKRGR